MVYSKKDLPTMTESERAFLNDFYKEDIARLAELLERDFSHWM